MNLLLYSFSFIIGTAIGSFLNVCIYRLPREMSVVFPASHCPNCGEPLAWYDNVPVLSYLFLGGKCRYCGVLISGRYALVELLTGVLFLATMYQLIGLKAYNPAEAGVVLIVASALIAGSFIDIERQIIPDEITLPGIVFGCLAGLIFPQIHSTNDYLLGTAAAVLPPHFFGLAASISGAAVGAGFIYLTGIIGRMIFRKEAMGLGDVKLMAMVGAFLGWRITLVSIFLGCIYGAVVGVGFIIVTRRRDSRIPFGPFLSMGVLSMLFFEPQLVQLMHKWQELLSAYL